MLDRAGFTRLSHRALLVLAGSALLGACGSAPTSGGASTQSVAAPPASTAAKPAAAAASPSGQASWDQIVAAGTKEGSVVLTVSPGPFRDWLANFEKAYPGIKLEVTQQNGSAFVGKILPERQSGQYAWDIYLGGAETGYSGLVPAGVLDPLRSIQLQPDVLDDSKWLGGFAGGFVDKGGQYVYNIEATVIPTVHVNRDIVPEAQLNHVEDLVNPAWKGKLSIFDPRSAGNGLATGSHWVMVKGPDFWRQILTQQPTITLDYRQQMEWVVRGQYPVAIAGNNRVLPDLQKEGVGFNVKPLAFDSDMGRRINQSISVGVINRRPHPNAAILFVNWLLSRDGQSSYVTMIEQGSRRLDAPAGPAGTQPLPGVTYRPSVNSEAASEFTKQALDIAKEMLK